MVASTIDNKGVLHKNFSCIENAYVFVISDFVLRLALALVL